MKKKYEGLSLLEFQERFGTEEVVGTTWSKYDGLTALCPGAVQSASATVRGAMSSTAMSATE